MDNERVERERRFTELFSAHHAQIVAYARRRVDASAVDDVVADTFLSAWLRFDGCFGDPLIWLYMLARGAVSHYRRGRERAIALTERVNAMEPPVPLVDAGTHVGWQDPFLVALSQLSELDREALEASVWEGLSPSEGAALQGCTIAAFKVRVHRARRRLRKLLTSDENAEAQCADEFVATTTSSLNVHSMSSRPLIRAVLAGEAAAGLKEHL